MKTCFLIFYSFFFISVCFAQESQDTVERKNKLSDSVVEKFYVLKNNHEIKQGPYLALLDRKKLIARGNYKNGIKTGLWQFYDAAGRLNEKYNYDLQKFTYEAPLESNDFSFLFEDTLKIGDRLTRPLRIGGVYYGFIPYLSLFRVPFDTYDINMESFVAYLELLISPMGRLAQYRVRIASALYQYDRIFTMDVKLFSDEDRKFIPATKNGENVISRILIKCYVTPSGTLDFL
ncbi:hypothetical protein [Mucilaginibacter sp.]|uniref:hypothetical protein n=1 Tax=Mucilaginibacter sp. TaxID=1882438 RepID=UPI002840C72F|nr:hypothetical protein [Mucilaginibacter sp.]MDR3697353.1 hypothetical protein [Mucilaginibacter sp.]